MDNSNDAEAFAQIRTESTQITVEICPATLSLAFKLSLARTDDEAVRALAEADKQISDWRDTQKQDDSQIVLLSGLRVTLAAI